MTIDQVASLALHAVSSLPTRWHAAQVLHQDQARPPLAIQREVRHHRSPSAWTSERRQLRIFDDWESFHATFGSRGGLVHSDAVRHAVGARQDAGALLRRQSGKLLSG